MINNEEKTVNVGQPQTWKNVPLELDTIKIKSTKYATNSIIRAIGNQTDHITEMENGNIPTVKLTNIDSYIYKEDKVELKSGVNEFTYLVNFSPMT